MKKKSNKAIMNQYTPIEIKHNVNNLNARTASEQFNNQLNMLNVNINNSNKNVGNNIPMSPYKNDYYRDTIARNIEIIFFNLFIFFSFFYKFKFYYSK